MFKFKRRLALPLMKEMIPRNRQNRHELWNNADFTLPLVKKGLESLIYLCPNIWEMLPDGIKQLKN